MGLAKYKNNVPQDQQQYDMLKTKTYADLYRDLRTAVDFCHRDGSLKKAVAANPSKFIHEDPLLRKTLEMLRSHGRKVFLATNSLWDFTNVVMNYLLLGKSGQSRSLEWLRYFDVVVVGCGKPAFFQARGQLFSVDVQTGLLRNTDNGAPTIPLDSHDDAQGQSSPQPDSEQPPPSCSCGPADAPDWTPVFQGGCYKDLHRILGVNSGDEVLYVGDHIFGDIVTSKRSVGWRTMLVVPELDVDLSLTEQSRKVHMELGLLREQRDIIDDEVQRYEWALTQDPMLDQPDTLAKNMAMLGELKQRRASLKERHSQLLAGHHARFHPVWGQLLKTGHQNSRYANQLERFACLYTSHVSNLAYYSPEKSFRGRLDYMAHDLTEDSF